MGSSEDAGIPEDEASEKSASVDPSTNQNELYSKLRAVEFEIGAVASSVEQVKNAANKEDIDVDGSCSLDDANKEKRRSAFQSSCNDLTLHHALAADRLKSLEKTKAQLKKELSGLYKGKASAVDDNESLLKSLVNEELSVKRKAKAQKKVNSRDKRHNTVSFNEDVDFDAVLDAASIGFVETVRENYLFIFSIYY